MMLIDYQVKNRIGYITLNRPEKRNALNSQMVTELKHAFSQAEHDEACKVIVLKANGQAFSAGAYLGYLQELQSNTFDENYADSSHLKERFEQIYWHKKVVIAQVEEPLLRTVLQETSGNQSKAAAMLGLNRGTLRKKLRQYHLI